MPDLTPQEKVFVDTYLEAQLHDDTRPLAAMMAAEKAYPNAAHRSHVAMSHEVLNRRDVQEAIVLGRGIPEVFTKEYLLLRLKEIIENEKANPASRVSAIKIAGEITGHLATAGNSKKPKSRAEELGETSQLKQLAAKAAEYQEIEKAS
jgi:hypothetical protein